MQCQTIGRYQIREELGRGAMGVVYRAEDSLIGRTVAIKTIRLDSFSDAAERLKLRERLLREARSAGVLTHQNIVTVYDAGEENGIAFIAMEYVAGQTLEQLLRSEQPLTCQQVVAVINEVATALDYAHSQGVVHRDIKPGNLMLAEDGSVRITDFGVAKLLSHQATQSDLMLGTPNYMAPEQIEARGVDGRTDQFALAVITYELLAGERPFHAETLSTLFLRILREDPAPPHLMNPTINERVSLVLARGLAKSPADRFATCSAFAKALSQGLVSCPDWKPLGRAAAGTMATMIASAKPDGVARPAPAPVEPPQFTKVEPPRSRWGTFAVISVIALVGLAAAGYTLYPWPQAPVAASTTPELPPPAPAEENSGRPSPLAEPNPPPPEPVPAPAVETASASAPPRPTRPPGPVSGVVEIDSMPSGATVRIDETRDQCKTPCSMELSQGRHVLHYSLAGHRDGTLVVTVPQESTARMRLSPMSGTLWVHTTPGGASVLINGQVQKDHSPAMLRLPPGKYKLTLRRDGKREHTQDVEVRDQTITQVEFVWP